MSAWDEYQKALRSTTNTGGASYSNYRDPFDAYQRYRSELLGREYEETEKERERREKERLRREKREAKNDPFAEAERRDQEAIATWGDDALGANKPEGIIAREMQANRDAIRRQEEAEIRSRTATQPSASGYITAGGATNAIDFLKLQTPAAENQKDERDETLARTQRTVDRIKAETEQDGLLYKLGIKKAQPVSKQEDDIKEKPVSEEVKALDKQLLQQLDQKIATGRTLTPDEEVQYSEAKLRQYYKQYPGLEKLITEHNDYHSASNAFLNSDEDDFKKSMYMTKTLAKTQDVENRIKDLTGWNDDELAGVLKYANRAQDRKDTVADTKKYEIDTNAPLRGQAQKGYENTKYSLRNNGGVENFIAWGEQFSNKPKGFGTNTDNGIYRKINNSNAAVAETTKAIQKDAEKIVSKALGEEKGKLAGDLAGRAYQSGVSAIDSELTKIPGLIVTAATGSKAAGDIVGLAPYYFKSFNNDYMEARNKGATDEEAWGRGVMGGLIEVGTELVGMDNFVNNLMGEKASKSFVKNLVKQMASEGLEEGVSDILNEFVDTVIYSKDPQVKSSFQQRIEETGSVKGAVGDFLIDMGLDTVFGALSAGPGSATTMGLGARGYRNMAQNISQSAAQASQNIQGDSTYEQSVKAQMEQYEKNPTRYVADNLVENTEDDKKRKAEVMKLAKKEAEGGKLTAGERLFIQEAIAESQASEEQAIKEGKTNERKEEEIRSDAQVPVQYRDKVSNLTEDEARTRLAEAAKAGDTEAFIDAMRMTRNSSYEEVANNAEQIIADYSGMAQSHGISKEDIGNSILTEKRAYIAALMGEELDTDAMAPNVKMAYNDGKIENLNSKVRTTIDTTDALKTDVTTKNGNTVKLDGVFTSDGKIQTDGGEIGIDDIEIDENRATNKAYVYADNYENVTVKNAFLANINDGQNIENYNRDFGRVYDSALAGLSLENVKKQSLTELSNDQIESIYSLAQNEKGLRAAQTLNEVLNGVKGNKVGKAINESSNQDADTTNMLGVLAVITGHDMVLVDDIMVKDPETGKMVKSNARGQFFKDQGRIVIRADQFNEAVAHEISHIVETYNKADYDRLRDAVANFAVDKMGADKFVNKVLGGYSDRYHAMPGQQKLQADDISGEMFNDIVPVIMKSKKGQKALAEFLARNYKEEEARTMGQQLADFMKGIGNAVKKLFGKEDFNNSYAREMSKYAEELGDMAEDFFKALEKAIANRNKALTGESVSESAGEGNAKFSLTFNDAVYQDQDKNDISGRDLLGEIQLKRLEESFNDYAKNPKKYSKAKDGDVIIPLEAIGGGIDKIIVAESNDRHLVADRIYVISDEVARKDLLVSLITQGEIRGDEGLYTGALRNVFGEQDFRKYVLNNNKTNARFAGNPERMDSFKNNGFGRNSLNRKGIDFKSAGGKSDVVEGSRFSLDSTGIELSTGQQEYFKNSAIRDKDGSLLQMHHGTASYGFDVFDIKKAKAANLYGRGFYFSKESSHAGQYGQQYDVYLNIVNPLQPGTKNITKNQLLKFINAVANNEDYGIENYGQNATPQSVLKSVWGKDDFSMLQDINATCIGDFAGALKEFNRINNTSYDGINTPTETVAFYANQIKDIHNENPTSADSMRFSLSEEDAKDIKKKAKKSKTVDVTKDLVAVHNLGEEQLVESLKLQGLPSPSIAIIRSGMMHDKYGEISLVFDSNTIDPEASKWNGVYGGDAWTPVFPQTEYKPNMKVAKNVRNMLDDLPEEVKQLGYVGLNEDETEDALNRGRGDVERAFGNIPQLKYMFITAKDGLGEKILEFPMVEDRDSFDRDIIEAVAKIIPIEAFNEGYNNVGYEEYAGKVREIANRLNYEKWAKKLEGKEGVLPGARKKILDKAKNQYEMYRAEFDNLMRDVQKYKNNNNEMPKKFDIYGFKDFLNEEIKGHEEEYKKWLENLFEGIIEKEGLRNNREYFDSMGNKRSWNFLHVEKTLQNIVDIMRSQKAKGEAGFFAASVIQALATKDFKSLDEIRANKGMLRMLTDEEYSQAKEAAFEKLNEIVDDIRDKREDNIFISRDHAISAINDAISGGRSVSHIDKVLREYTTLDIKKDTAQKVVDLVKEISEIPTGYFEAKPMRPVWLEEIKKAVIPDNVSEDTIKALDDAGIPYEMYRYEDEGQRRDIIAAMEDVKFSLSEDTEGRELTDDQVKYFKNSRAVDSKGRLLELYHGTESQAFSVFSTPGIWVTPDKELATEYAGEWNNWRNERDDYGHIKYETNGMEPEVYGDKYLRIYKVYANVTNPVFLGELNRTLPDDYAGMEFDTLGIKTEEQFDKLYDLVQQHIGDKVWQLTETKEFIDLMKELGYDGMFASENGHRTICVFNSNQLKNINNLNPTSSEDIRYALDLAEDEGGWVDFDAELGTTSEEEKAVDILAKGMEAMKNKEVDVPKLRSLALKLRREYGSTYNVNKLTEDLEKAFAYMQTEDHVDYPTMMGILKDIARPVIEEAGEKVGEEEYKNFIDYFKGKKIKLTQTQKDEVASTFGSYGKFRNAIMPITISDNGDYTLDQIWEEIAQASGNMVDISATEGQKPQELYDALQALKPYVSNDFGGDTEDLAKDLAMRIVEEYIEGEASKDMHKQLNEYRDKLKKDYNKRLENLKGRANAEVLARNKKKAEQAKERREARDLRQKIKQNANKLYTWAAKPTEGKSVPHNMMVPVMQFLQAIDFVDPIVTVSEDGKHHIRLFDHVDYEEGHKKFIYKDLVGDTREDVLKQFNEAIGRGEGTKEQKSWTDKMQGIRDIYNKVLMDTDFEDTSMDFLMQTLDAQGLAEEFDDMLSRHKGQLNMNNLTAKELKLINNVITNIFHAVNQGNKAYSMNADIVNLAQDTIKESEGKTLKNRNKYSQMIHDFLRIDNATPVTFFDLLGKGASKIYGALRNGLNQEILDIKKASEFMEGIMKEVDKKEVQKWTGKKATVHEFNLTNGSIKMTDAQIMGLYLTIRRTGGRDRIKGGIKVGDIKQNGKTINQDVIHLTDGDIKQIESVLTPEQISLAQKMQKYMAEDCSAQGNETSMKLYGYKKFTDPTYYPWTVDKDTVATTNTSENIPMFNSLERSGFTKQLKEGASNPLVINDIFDVFTDHVSQMAGYHGYAASLKDTLRWMNYREMAPQDGGFVKYITNKNAINVLSGSKKGVGYIRDLMLDINKARKSDYIGNVTEALMGNYKAAAVGANARVVMQQPTAYLRALNIIDPQYLMGINPATAVKNIKKSQEECPISWWKSKGYYETNLGQPLKEIVTGIASPTEKAKDVMMAPAGYADDVTWGFLYTAVEKEQRAKFKGQNVSAEEFRKAVNDRFDELVDTTQVVDSALHRSAYMRSKDKLNILQTAFMAEPTKTYNMIMKAVIEDMREGKTMKRTSRAAIAFLLTAIFNAAAQSIPDVWRHAGDDDDFWEKFMEYLQSNFTDNINPLNLLPIVKDIAPELINTLTGESTWSKSNSRFDIDALTTIFKDAGAVYKYLQGEGNKTGYGAIMSVLRPISQVTGIPLYNLTRDTVGLYNAFFTNIETTINNGTTRKNEKKKSFVTDVNKEKSEDTLDEGIVDALNSGVSIYDLKGAIKSEYKNKYFDAYSEGNMEEAQAIAERAARAYARMGMSDEDIDAEINEWQEETITYSLLDKAIAKGEGIEEEIRHVQEGKEDDKIIKHIMDRYADTIAYEDTHDTESDWRGNVEKALQAIDPTLTFDTANEEAIKEKAKKEKEAAEAEEKKGYKEEFFASVETKNGTAGRKALDGLKAMGVDATGAKKMVSTQYHDAWKDAKSPAEKQKAKADWMSAYKLVCNYYGADYKDLEKTWSDWEKDQKDQ